MVALFAKQRIAKHQIAGRTFKVDRGEIFVKMGHGFLPIFAFLHREPFMQKGAPYVTHGILAMQQQSPAALTTAGSAVLVN